MALLIPDKEIVFGNVVAVDPKETVLKFSEHCPTVNPLVNIL